jgi:hypothetical protein
MGVWRLLCDGDTIVHVELKELSRIAGFTGTKIVFG